MEQIPPDPSRRFGLVMRFFIWLTGADAETLSRCPARDIGSIIAIALLMILVFIYQTFAFSLAGHTMLAADGTFRPVIVIGAAMLSTIVLIVDSELVMRSTWHLHGIRELRRGGIDVSGGFTAQAKNVFFLAVRISLAIVFAQLTAVFLSLLLFEKDVARDLDRTYREANSSLFAAAATRVDGAVQNTADARAVSASRIAEKDREAAGLRATIVDPPVDEPLLKPTLGLVEQREAAKAEAERALEAAEEFATNELAGFRGATGNSGVPGYGPVRQAAEERVDLSRERVREAARELEQAQVRLLALQASIAAAKEKKRQQAEARLAEVAGDLQAEQSRYNALETEHRRLVEGREDIINAVVLRDPSRVPRQEGFLANLEALHRLAQANQNFMVILLIDLGAMGIELAAVLAKVTAFVPTTYATRLARDAYMQAYYAAKGISDETGGDEPESSPPPADGGGGPSGSGNGHALLIPDTADPAQAETPAPVLADAAKRKRGRPPKQRLGSVSAAPSPNGPAALKPEGEDIARHDEADKG